MSLTLLLSVMLSATSTGHDFMATSAVDGRARCLRGWEAPGGSRSIGLLRGRQTEDVGRAVRVTRYDMATIGHQSETRRPIRNHDRSEAASGRHIPLHDFTSAARGIAA